MENDFEFEIISAEEAHERSKKVLDHDELKTIFGEISKSINSGLFSVTISRALLPSTIEYLKKFGYECIEHHMGGLYQIIIKW